MTSPSAETGSPATLLPEISSRLILADGLVADFFCHPSGEPQPALVLLGGSEGGKSWSGHPEHIRQFVDGGYTVLSLAYFGVDPLPSCLQALPLEYFTKAFHWLYSRREGIPGGVTLLGVSRGAELALLLGCNCAEVDAVVAIAPSSVVFPGAPKNILDALRGQHSAWNLQGREMSFVPLPYSWITLRGLLTGRRTRMFEEALRNDAAVKAASIPVERIHGPVLLESFTRDQVWPSTRMANQVAYRLVDRGYRFYFKHNAYDTVHSDWSFAPCWKNILGFLREQRAAD
jgi:BAAT / Acyl-CoA thioester hydrolase C terminal.